VIDHGTVIAEGTSAQLKASVGTGTLRVRVVRPDQGPAAARVLERELGTAIDCGPDSSQLTTRIAAVNGDGAGERAGHALVALSRAAIEVSDFSLGQPTLDEAFLTLTGHSPDSNREG
jgi:ABC-2 type transport system ATP-binding protein